MYFLNTIVALAATLILSVTAAPTDIATIQVSRNEQDHTAPATQCGWFYYYGEGEQQPLYANGYYENLEEFSVMGSILVQTCFCIVYKAVTAVVVPPVGSAASLPTQIVHGEHDTMEQLTKNNQALSELITDDPTVSNGCGSASVSHITPQTPYPRIITLDVGGRKYKTSIATLLAESGLFRVQLSDRFTWAPEADGSYFLDADPDLFEHLLRFMRRPNVFPLFYSKAAGFDYNLYSQLEEEAEYFQMDELHAWIKKKKYLEAIVTKMDCPITMDLADISLGTTCGPNVTCDRYMLPRVRKVYICPRDIVVHRGDPNRCGAACRRAQGDEEPEFEEETYVEVVSVRNEVIFKAEACRLE
ncbi:hypothetical protein DE146DRAFT_765053 [Phaeosphaeria sp. MPI-PUGE-AT-0046c]|nr:hypothetical protein DE146DRAFT_765053 [Phaeosphaeria sp. MPI-PUGE-AT-0046c]